MSDAPETIDVAVRRERSGMRDPILFFYEGRELTCYAHIGQHSAASVWYMRDRTRATDPQEADAAALLREWENLGPPDQRVTARVVKRLRRPD